ncbi:MAG: VCBS repeat-containing protein [Deltaproteobacteria bacterium]|nr:VCBS repeat-containing protein [Deltaproteobacteria bacterium]
MAHRKGSRRMFVCGFAMLAAAACPADEGSPVDGDGGAETDGEGITDVPAESDGAPDADADGGADGDHDADGDDAGPLPPACDAAPGGGSATVQAPVLVATLFDRWHEAWLGSPAVADLDGDGTNEILVPRDEVLLGWHIDGSVVFRQETRGRIWAPPVVGDLVPSRPGLEVAVASRGSIHVWDAAGTEVAGFPATWQDELRSLAAGDIDGDGALELVAVTTNPVEGSGQRDLLIAFETDGRFVAGFPPNTTGASGCDDRCYQTGGYDQNLALGDVDGDGAAEVFGTQDNAYLSLHDGAGRAFDADPIFDWPTKFNGIRFLHDYALAQQGWSDDEENDNQAHFTNSAPAIVDVDGDGDRELVVLASVQNAAQSDRLRGVALWVVNEDGTRPEAWTTPFHAPDYLAGLWDFDGTNVVGATNQVGVADLDPGRAGPEFVFAGFDGRIHAVASDAAGLWTAAYTTSDRVLTGGVAIADLSGDGSPEIVFNSYSPDGGLGNLFVLDARGAERHRIPLPGRGAMPVPTLADVEGDGTLEIIVSLKDGEDRVRQVLVYTVPGSSTNCLPWPTGRRDLLRDGAVP